MLRNTDNILARKKPAVLQQYRRRMSELEIPEGVRIPDDPREALLLGMRIARRRAYEDGIVDGVNLGVEVFVEAAAH